MNDDNEQLRLLGIFHYVVAGFAALFALFPIFHLVIGILAVSGRLDDSGGFEGSLFGWFFIAFALAWIIGGLAVTVCLAYAGTCLRQHRRYYFCLVMAALACGFVPFGTVLGVLTIIVLVRPSVKALFGIAPLSTP